jgi:hypothetical protein
LDQILPPVGEQPGRKALLRSARNVTNGGLPDFQIEAEPFAQQSAVGLQVFKNACSNVAEACKADTDGVLHGVVR